MQGQDMERALRPRIYRRLGLTLGLGGLFLGLLAQRMPGVDPGLVVTALGRIGPGPLVAACLATGLSFWAVAGYDWALHRHLRTGVDPARARQAGFAAIAIGQTVGLGVVSGALVRWRLLPELGLLGAMRLAVLVAGSFLGVWAVLTSVVLMVLPDAPLVACAPWVLVVAGLGLAAALSRPRPWMPNLLILARLAMLAAVDCLAAGLALWLLIPGDPGFATFLPVFLLALGAGLVSGSPAGLGAFEIVLLGLLPYGPEPGLLAAILVWRLIYFALPALIGAAVALRAASEPPVRARAPIPPPPTAEGGLVAQGDLFVHPSGFVAGRTVHGLLALSDVADLARFRAAAGQEGRWPVLYKASARLAVQARRAGLAVLPVAREAWLRPQDFRLDLPSRAGLRRKLRKAGAAGVTAALDLRPDWAALATANAAWVAARGGEHGFTMGRFEPRYLAGQRVVVARQGAQVAGFASFHAVGSGDRAIWTLDLLRPLPTAPDGTAQLLVMAALAAARAAGVAWLSLAAVPIGCDPGEAGPVARAGRSFAPGAMTGLCQFKAGFAPDWRQLYIAGPSRAALALVGLEIWRAVRHPPPLAKMSPTTGQVAEYEIAYRRNPWQREEDSLT